MSALKVPSSKRDPIAELVRYNGHFTGTGRDPSLLRQKLDKLCASPFGFFRGSFHLFVRDWQRPELELGQQPIVGDVHLENFGAYRSEGGETVFGVNDFDEAGTGSPLLDLQRTATSILLSAPSASDAVGSARIENFVEAWCEAHASHDAAPVETHEVPHVLRKLLEEESEESRRKWLDKRVETIANQRRYRDSDKYQRIFDPTLIAHIRHGLLAYAQTLVGKNMPSEWPSVLDFATRIAGTGSLGRHRWAVLIESKNNRRGKERVLELKEALPSSLEPKATEDPAEQVIALQRLLQGAVPAYLGATHVADVPYTVRELQPTEAKAEVATLDDDDLDALCVASGTALGRLHRRGLARPEPTSIGQRILSKEVAPFAHRYAEVVRTDFKLLKDRRADVERALGL